MANHQPTGTGTPAKFNSAQKNTPYKITAIDFLKGFSDDDKDVLKIVGNSPEVDAKQGTLVKTTAGWTFTPAKDFVGNVTIDYVITDSKTAPVHAEVSFEVVGSADNIVNVSSLSTKSSSAIQAKDYMLALLSDDKVNAARWENADGSVKKEITYSFISGREISNSIGETATSQNWNADTSFYDAIKTQIENALKFYASIIPVTFTEAKNAGGADFKFYAVDDEWVEGPHPAQMQRPVGTNPVNSIPGDSNYLWFNEPGTALFVNDSNYGQWYLGSQIETDELNIQGTKANNLIVHELGHGLGLLHPHNGILFPGLKEGDEYIAGTNGLNSTEFSVMSYNKQVLDKQKGFAATPMALDIAALQYLYGANTDYRTGSDSYKLSADSTDFYCIWDNGGSDSIEVSDGSFFSKNATIDLRAATIDIKNLDAIVKDSSLGGYVSKISGIAGGFTIAHGVVIENAVGGSGNDLITGNDVANALKGNDGADTLVGGLGRDVLTGGNGADVFKFNSIKESAGLTVKTNDVIMDFVSGTDKIDLSGIDADTTTKVNDAFKTLELGTKDVVFKLTNALYFNTATHILYGNNDKDNVADFSIQLSGVSSLFAGDFIL